MSILLDACRSKCKQLRGRPEGLPVGQSGDTHSVSSVSAKWRSDTLPMVEIYTPMLPIPRIRVTDVLIVLECVTIFGLISEIHTSEYIHSSDSLQ